MYPSDMDPECKPLCDALNKVPGVKTIGSCSGHDEYQLWVTFTCTRMYWLKSVMSCADIVGWEGRLWASGPYGIVFGLDSDDASGDKAYTEAKALTEEILTLLEEK